MTYFGKKIMAKSQLLSGLRTEISRLEIGLEIGLGVGVKTSDQKGTGDPNAGMFSFGDPAIDQKLPNGGLPLAAVHEIRGDVYRDAGALGFMAGLLSRAGEKRTGSVLWCRQKRHSQTGFVYGPGLSAFGLKPERFIFVMADDEAEVLWVAEEGLKCHGISAIVIEMDQLDLTGSRRLQLAATAVGIPVFVLNGHHERDLSPLGATTAMSRWSVGSVEKGWHVVMERCRGGAPRSWMMEWNDETHSFSVAAQLANRTRTSGAEEITPDLFDEAA